MNNVINKLLLAGDKFHLLNIKKEFKSLKKLEIQRISIKINWIKLLLLMMPHILIVKILQKEPLQIKF